MSASVTMVILSPKILRLVIIILLEMHLLLNVCCSAYIIDIEPSDEDQSVYLSKPMDQPVSGVQYSEPFSWITYMKRKKNKHGFYFG